MKVRFYCEDEQGLEEEIIDFSGIDLEGKSEDELVRFLGGYAAGWTPRCENYGWVKVETGKTLREKRELWSGEWPGKAECRELGLYCRSLSPEGLPYTPENPCTDPTLRGIRWHIPCDKDDPGAYEDLNRLAMYRSKKG